MLKRGKLHTANGKLVIYVQNEGMSLIDGSYNMLGVVPTE